MAWLNVYVPDDLAEAAGEAGLNVSALTQHALNEALARRATDTWLSGLDSDPMGAVTHDQVLAALDAAREELDA